MKIPVGILSLVVALCLAYRAWPADDPIPLGSPEYRPTPQQPFGFRGDGTGRFPGATPPTQWSPTKNIRWSCVVGPGHSSPILTDKLVLVTSEPDLLLCIDRAYGTVRWKLKTTPADLTDATNRDRANEYKLPKNGSGMMAATPLTDGRSVYIVLANGIVRAIGLDGKPAWTAFVDAEQCTAYGRASSPIIIAGKLVVHITNLYAFDPATGKRLWAQKDAKSTYGTPAGLAIGGTDLIATSAGDIVRAADGKLLNSEVGKATYSSPIAAGAILYYGDASPVATRLSAAFKDQELWTATITGDVFGSPLLHDGILFTVAADGKLYAFAAAGQGSQTPLIAGRPLFPERDRATPEVYASLALAGQYLFLNSTRGETVVLEATAQAREVARNSLPAGTGASPVFSGKHIFVRDGGKLLCVGE